MADLDVDLREFNQNNTDDMRRMLDESMMDE